MLGNKEVGVKLGHECAPGVWKVPLRDAVDGLLDLVGDWSRHEHVGLNDVEFDGADSFLNVLSFIFVEVAVLLEPQLKLNSSSKP